jgi:hypothetical protein
MKAAAKVVKEEKSVDQLMTDLGDAILGDNNEAMKIAFKNLKAGLKSKAKGYLEKKFPEKPAKK